MKGRREMCPIGEVSLRTRASDPNEDTHLIRSVHSSTRPNRNWCGWTNTRFSHHDAAEISEKCLFQQRKKAETKVSALINQWASGF
ncbi:hypothetical protein CEE69_01660 [Rhodopirellula bahusiensis]|uniref:Uncharacterized protein n=1 Tax=Rhodopirellula bahusiensis TaxID=2014065 RepID=A0A2G1WDF9_9BACT|nr:hypothetical protein CEE69_01660 [Rhodopirellula bahusiensis]